MPPDTLERFGLNATVIRVGVAKARDRAHYAANREYTHHHGLGDEIASRAWRIAYDAEIERNA